MFHAQVRSCNNAPLVLAHLSPPGVVAPNTNPGPSPSIILLNIPSALPPASSGYYDNYAAPVQPSESPSIINLNAPAVTPPVLKLNRRQVGSTSPANTFSFGGMVPTGTTASPPPSFSTPTTTTIS